MDDVHIIVTTVGSVRLFFVSIATLPYAFDCQKNKKLSPNTAGFSHVYSFYCNIACMKFFLLFLSCLYCIYFSSC